MELSWNRATPSHHPFQLRSFHSWKKPASQQCIWRAGNLQSIPTKTGCWFGCHFFKFSHDYWEFHHPNWRTHIFQRGGPTTNQKMAPCQPSSQGPLLPPWLPTSTPPWLRAASLARSCPRWCWTSPRWCLGMWIFWDPKREISHKNAEIYGMKVAIYSIL